MIYHVFFFKDIELITKKHFKQIILFFYHRYLYIITTWYKTRSPLLTLKRTRRFFWQMMFCFVLENLPLYPVFLLQGNTGSGREILLTSLSSRLGMHFYKIYNNELYANVYAQNETKLKNAFFTAKMAAPCVICIKQFEVSKNWML